MTTGGNRIVLVGGGGHAGVIVSALRKLDAFEIAGYVDPDPGCALSRNYPELKRFGDESALEGVIRSGAADCAIVAVGSTGKDAKRRADIFLRVQALGFRFPSVISADATVDETANIGPGTVVMPGAICNRGAQIGTNCIINTGAIVEHDTRVGDHSHLATGVRTGGGTVIGACAHIGTGAVIIHAIRIGAGATVGAGAAVVRDVADGSLALGVPAKERKQ